MINLLLRPDLKRVVIQYRAVGIKGKAVGHPFHVGNGLGHGRLCRSHLTHWQGVFWDRSAVKQGHNQKSYRQRKRYRQQRTDQQGLGQTIL